VRYFFYHLIVKVLQYIFLDMTGIDFVSVILLQEEPGYLMVLLSQKNHLVIYGLRH